MESLKVYLKLQSISDIITNSSSEVFCRIESDNISTIHEFLEGLGIKFKTTDYIPDENMIEFSVEYGSEDQIILQDNFMILLTELLSNNFPKGSYKIRTDVY